MQIPAEESRFFGLIGGRAEGIVIYRNAYSTFINLINYPGNGCVWDYHSKEFQAGLFVVAHELGRSVLGGE